MSRTAAKSKANSSTKLFVSHATADKLLVGKFVEMLRLGVDLPRERIFCTSLQGMKIPPGKVFAEFIKTELKDCVFVVAIITPSYYESAFCLCEAGATWILDDKNFFPILVPPLKYEDLKAVLTGTQAGYINAQEYLDELHDHVRATLDLGQGSTANWGVQRDAFLNQFPSIKIAGPTNIPIARYDALSEKYELSQKALLDKNGEIEELNNRIAALEALKDAAQVADVRRSFSNEQERFEAILEEFKQEKLPDVVIEALYYDQKGDDWILTRNDDRWDEIISCEEDGYLWTADQTVHVSTDCPPVKRAQKVLEDLDGFLNHDSTEEFHQDFLDQNDYKLTLSNKRFWREYLGL